MAQSQKSHWSVRFFRQLRFVSELGLKYANGADMPDSVRLCNTVAGAMIFLAAPWVLLLAYRSVYVLAGIGLFAQVLFVCTLLLSRSGKFLFARHCLLFTFCFSILLATLAYGADAQVYWFCMPTIFMIFQLEKQGSRSRRTWLWIASALLFYCCSHDASWLPIGGKELKIVQMAVLFILLPITFLQQQYSATLIRNANDAVVKNGARYKFIFDSTAESICVLDAKGNFAYANKSCLDSLGYVAESQVLGKSFHMLALHSHVDGSLYVAEEGKLGASFRCGEIVHGESIFFWRSNGNFFPAEYWAHPLREGENVTGAVITFMDISERTKAEAKRREIEIALQRKNSELKILLESMTEGVVHQDSNLRVVEFNTRALEILGLSESELRSRTSMDPRWKTLREDGSVLPPSEFASVLALTTGEPQLNLLVGVYRDNEQLRWLSVNATPVFEEGRLNPSQVLSTFRDITEERSAQNLIKEERLLLQSVLDNSPSAIYAKDLEGKYILVNSEFERLFRKNRKDIIGKTDADFFPPERANTFRANDAKIVHQQCAMQFEERVPSTEGVFDYLSVKFPLRSIDGKITAVCGISTDMTERKQLSAQIEEAKTRMEIVMRAVRFGIWDWDFKNNVLVWDDFMYEIFGINKADFTGAYEAFERTLLPEDAKRVGEELQATFKRQGDFTSEFRIARKSGEIRIIRADAKCFYDKEGKIDRLVGANWDITDARENEARLFNASKLSSLGEMSAGIAHEINNPLAIIKGKAQLIGMLLEKPDFAVTDLTKQMDGIVQTVDRIAKIVSGLRTFARDGAEDPFTATSLKTIIEDTIGFCSSRFANHGVVLRVPVIDEMLFLECRPTQVSQILLNLLSNSYDAIQESAEKWVAIEVKDLGDKLEIAVVDSGGGIPLSVQSKMMQPFFTTKAVGKGTGLGLSISGGIARGHNGSLEYDRNAKNTRFVLVLPKKQSMAESKAA